MIIENLYKANTIIEIMIRDFQNNPYLLDFMREAVKWDKEKLDMSLKMLEERKTA